MFQIRDICVLAMFICITSSQNQTEPKIWAFLVAGSNEYKNYRHQANVCHAYQRLKANGIPDDNIVVMMYDDIANNTLNPTPGKIFNQPGGENVYEGVLKDYTQKDVNKKNFVSILKAEEEKLKGVGSGKVIKSTENDYLLVYYTDHGGHGMLAFIDTILYAEDLQKILLELSINKKFAKMLLIVEACYSGSMFDDILDDDLNIFVMTSADNKESSYACYPDLKVGTFLSGEFSASVLGFLDSGEFQHRSIHHLFSKVRTKVSKSHSEEYGNLDLGSGVLHQFVGKGNFTDIKNRHGPLHHGQRDQYKDAVPSLEVPLAILRHKIEASNSEEEKLIYQHEIEDILEARRMVDRIIYEILFYVCENDEEKFVELQNASFKLNKENMHCAKEVTQTFSSYCFNIAKNPYTISVTRDLVKTCNLDWTSQEKTMDIIRDVCSEIDTNNIGIIE